MSRCLGVAIQITALDSHHIFPFRISIYETVLGPVYDHRDEREVYEGYGNTLALLLHPVGGNLRHPELVFVLICLPSQNRLLFKVYLHPLPTSIFPKQTTLVRSQSFLRVNCRRE